MSKGIYRGFSARGFRRPARRRTSPAVTDAVEAALDWERLAAALPGGGAAGRA